MILYIAIILGFVILDQITKFIVFISMTEHQSIPIFKNFFYLTSVRNTGAAWSKFENQMGLFYIISLLAIGLFAYFLITTGDLITKKIYTISLILVIAGTIGNFIDRLFRKEVIDFLDIIIFGYDFPIFNLADICLTIGTIGIAISVLFYE